LILQGFFDARIHQLASSMPIAIQFLLHYQYGYTHPQALPPSA